MDAFGGGDATGRHPYILTFPGRIFNRTERVPAPAMTTRHPTMAAGGGKAGRRRGTGDPYRSEGKNCYGMVKISKRPALDDFLVIEDFRDRPPGLQFGGRVVSH